MKISTAFLKYDYGIKERGISTEKQIFYEALKKISKNIVSFWLEENGYPDDIQFLQKRIIEFVKKEKPYVMFLMLMKDEISIETLKELKKYTITLNWFWDDHWRFESFTKIVAPHLSYSITVDKYSISKYYHIGCQNVILSQGAAFEYIKKIDNKIKYKYDITFIGGKNETREWIINYLQICGIHVKCFGSGWGNGRVSYEEMKKIFMESKINLNLSNSLSYDIRFYEFIKNRQKNEKIEFNLRMPIQILKMIKRKIISSEIFSSPKNVEQIKARNFEIPGCGGFQLTNYVLSLEDYYIIGKEIAVYSNVDDLKTQIEYYLINKNEREKIKLAGYKRSKEYTYETKFKNILSFIRKYQ